ncbi:glucosamine-6-phosphate deaminase [Corynebacterium pacaense]|uniref:glucosamine-6-phosphate deaminase n=1 Tax=Corynebacterium pacaense TaxID=1816684 RepID=UPI0009B9CEB7|nr:glucosamine-6-phosphate deaminase [Corynebacterium pacaense]
MDILIRDSAEEVGVAAADLISGHVGRNETIGLATGSSPLPTYRELIRRVGAGQLSFRNCRAFLLDEYLGLGPGDPHSYHRTIRDVFTAHIDIEDSEVVGPDGTDPDPRAAAARYERRVVGAGVGVQLLGIGVNGHIGFNEPSSSLNGETTVQALHPQTVRDNARFFDSVGDVPDYAITQGLGTIMRAGHLVLVATGTSKAEAVRSMIEGPVSAFCPASVLQLHPRASVILDEEAAAGLGYLDFYRSIDARRFPVR